MEVSGETVDFIQLCSHRPWLCQYALGHVSGRPLAHSTLWPLSKARIQVAKMLLATIAVDALEETPADIVLEQTAKKRAKLMKTMMTKQAKTHESLTIAVDMSPATALTRAQGKGDDIDFDTIELRVLNQRGATVWIEKKGLAWIGAFLTAEQGKANQLGTVESTVSATRFQGPVFFLPPHWIVNGPLMKRRFEVAEMDTTGKRFDADMYRR
jgi:hypothetical protein